MVGSHEFAAAMRVLDMIRAMQRKFSNLEAAGQAASSAGRLKRLR